MNSSTSTETGRVAHLRALAARLLFEVEQHGDRYTLVRTDDVSRPVRHLDLTLAEAEDLLATWKLRGFHGG